jgi:gamma-glutamylcyclotransferase (GGCT)/AIG2-like uncharacterized protein YtfP
MDRLLKALRLKDQALLKDDIDVSTVCVIITIILSHSEVFNMTEKQQLYSQMLFSYGTLQNEAVQYGTFGRKLNGQVDSIVGYVLDSIEICDPKISSLSGKNIHPIIKFTGDPTNTVLGCVFEISEEELQQADTYEIANYKRVCVPLLSGLTAWAYVAKD